jgi:hypothetical protein
MVFRQIALLIFLSGVSNLSFGQFVEEKYSETLWATNDTFAVKFSYTNYRMPFQVSKKDTVGVGGDGALNLNATIYYGKDSAIFNYNNLPFGQAYWIPIQSPKGKTLYRLHFNSVMAAFPEKYIEKNKGNVQFEIPEVYELANILWTLSPTGQRANGLNKNGDYYHRVLSWFKPVLSHPIFEKLDFPDSLYLKSYLDFRENSFAFSFKKDQLAWDGPYFYVMGSNSKDFNSLFKQLAPLIEDFGNKSNFRAFYKSNVDFYSEQIQRQKELMPVKNMWNWLENHFPNKYNSYKVIFSPLIGTSHSTQNFYTFYQNQLYRETVMFISAPSFYDTTKQNSQSVKEGLASGILFTEIDHNYINPVSDKYRKLIDSIFSKRIVWTDLERNKSFYANPVDVFNEYMTHAVFCLWLLDNYDSNTAKYVLEKREELMINRRGFIKFKQFTDTLINLYGKNKNIKIADLYPDLLKWCKTQL